jgi:hypothetical protein
MIDSNGSGDFPERECRMNLTRATAVLLGALLWAVLPARAESPANFSGTWELDRSRSVLPSRASALPGNMTLVIDHNGETVKIERRINLMALHRTITSTYYTDGRETSNLTPRGETVISRSHWEGTSLVTSHRGMLTQDGRTETVESTDVKHLSEDGKVLFIDSTSRRAGQDNPERSRLVFIRK